MFYYPGTTVAPPFNSGLIRVNYTSTMTATQEAAFDAARDTWNTIITQRLSNVNIDGEVTDQIIIDASIIPIDGEFGTLGQAGPTSIRSGSQLTAKGEMEFDEADMDSLEADGDLEAVILHEMGHVLGIGTLWPTHNLIQDSGTATSRFTGAKAREEYGVLLGTNVDTDVPLETMMGSGSNDAHWAEQTFDKELMTPTLDSGANPTSRLTIASLEDLGYSVNYTLAEAYSLPNPFRRMQLVSEAGPKDPGCRVGKFDADKLEVLDEEISGLQKRRLR